MATRRRAAILGAAALAMVVAVVVLAIVLSPKKPKGQPATLEAAFEALDQQAYAEARQMAEQVRDGGSLPSYRLGELAFILGTVALHDADNSVVSDKTKLYLMAARYLEEAHDRGFPPGREADGSFALGRSLYLSGQISASRSVLREALALNEEKRTEIHHLLADACLNDARPKFAEALDQNGLYLGDPTLTASERYRGLAQQAQILLQMGRTAECLKALEQIPDGAGNRADAMVLRGRLLIDQARRLKRSAAPADQTKARQQYEAAVKVLRQAQGRDTLDTQATRKSLYLIGLCFAEMGDARAALAQFVRTRTLFPDAPEGQAASLEEAEIHRQAGRNAEALASYRRALKPITSPDDYRNPWIPLDQLRARMLNAYRHYLNVQNCEVCLKLTAMLSPLFSRARATELAAEAHRAWGRQLLTQAEHLSPGKAEPLARQGREQLRKAGRAYAQLAELRPAARQYPDDLWESALCYFDGQDYRNAARRFPEYLTVESRRHQSLALVNLGEALLSLGRTDEALLSLRECIDLYPRDPLAFKARLLASDACVEKHDPEQAEALLRENLNGGLLAPASKEWRDSLFALGRLLHASRRHEEAIRLFDEAVQRYPDVPQAIEGRYLMAESYLRSAESAQEQMGKDLAESRRAAYSKKARECLNAALTQYQTVQELLSRRQETTELLPAQKTMLRNCYFAVGEVLFGLEQYEAAVKAYSTVTHRCQNASEVLEAYLQIARAYRRMNKLAEARGALQQAKGVLSRMKADAPFTETTNHARQEWTDLLAKLTAS